MRVMYRTKDITVNIVNLKPEIKEYLPLIGAVIKGNEGYKYVMTITSGNDGIHMKKSKHYEGEAIDIRIRDMKYKHTNVENLKILLGNNYDVVLEKDHIHIEYDKK